VRGRKRFQLFGPAHWRNLQLHPQAHPAHRQSQLGFSTNEPAAESVRAGVEGDGDALTVTLEPGDMLFLPPFWFHRVTAVGFSIGLSVHTQTEAGEHHDSRACDDKANVA